MYRFVCATHTANTAVSICQYILLTNIYEDDLQLGKLKENCLLLKLYRKLRKMFLNHLSPGSSMVRASHRRSELGSAGSIPVWGSEKISLSLR